MPGKGKRLTLLTAAVLVIVAAILATNYWPELVAQYRFWQNFESLERNEQGYAEYRHRQTGIVFVSLPGGTFLMGTSEEEADSLVAAAVWNRKWIDIEKIASFGKRFRRVFKVEQPQHEVTLSPFLIAKYEVSQVPSRATRDLLPSGVCQSQSFSWSVSRSGGASCRAPTGR